MPAPLRNPPDEAVELIKSFEGIPDGDPSTVNIDAYLCPANVWTIGWGHAIVHEGQQLKGPAAKALARQLYPGGITMAQAVALLRADLLRFCAGVQRLVTLPVNDAQFGGLLAFAFNAGLGSLGQSTLLRKLNAGDVAGAAEEFLRWDKARVNGVLQPMAGLTRRRRAERALFLGDDWRAVAAQRVTRSGGSRRPPVLPVPEAPEDQAVQAAAALSSVQTAADQRGAMEDGLRVSRALALRPRGPGPGGAERKSPMPVAKRVTTATTAKTAARTTRVADGRTTAAAKAVAKTAGRTAARPAAKPAVKTASKTATKTAAKTAAKTAKKTPAKAAAKTGTKAASKATAKTASGTVTKPVPKKALGKHRR